MIAQRRNRRALRERLAIPASLLALMLLMAPLAVPATSAALDPPLQADEGGVQSSYEQLPLAFEANRGQTDADAQFLARGAGYTLFLTTAGEAVLALQQPNGAAAKGKENPTPAEAILRVRLLGANPAPRAVARDELPGKANYFLGNDSRRWLTDVPTYATIEYRDVYPGVNLVYYGAQRQLEYDLVVASGADPEGIILGFEGADAVEVDAQGDLVLHVAGGQVRQHRPVVYQEVDRDRRLVVGGYAIKGENQVGFEVGAYDRGRPLVIDPVLVYSTYHGGSGFEQGFAIAVDGAGNAYLTGETTSPDFPTQNALQPAYNGGPRDGFVTKLNPQGTALVYSTYLGGSGFERSFAIAVDSAGNAYLTGGTDSPNFPTLNAAQPGLGGGMSDAFVTKLNAAGNGLVYSTYLGGGGTDVGRGIALDAAGSAYLTGETTSLNFPVLNAAQPTNGGVFDAFVTKLNPAGSALGYSTYLGGSDTDNGFSIAVDGSGNAHVAGYTLSANFPTLNPLQPAFGGGGQDGFVAKLNAAGSALVYSTYLGGSGTDVARSIAVDAGGSAYVAGETRSPNFPLRTPLQPALGGGQDAFVAKLNVVGSALVYSTYLGGNRDDAARAIAFDATGNVYVTGTTASTNFPTPNALQRSLAGDFDAFVAKLNAAGTTLAYSTYLGGSRFEHGLGIAVGPAASVLVTGATTSTNFPIQNPRQSALAGIVDAFVARIADAASPTSLTVTQAIGLVQPSGQAGSPCASRAGQVCQASGAVSGTGTLGANAMTWSLIATVPVGVTAGTVPIAVISTTTGLQGFPCAAVVAGAGTVVCSGTTSGAALQGSTVTVVFAAGVLATGTATGPGPAAAGAPAAVVPALAPVLPPPPPILLPPLPPPLVPIPPGMGEPPSRMAAEVPLIPEADSIQLMLIGLLLLAGVAGRRLLR